MDRGLSTFSPLAPLVRTLGGPNERLCHFYTSRLALALARAYSVLRFLLMMVANTGAHGVNRQQRVPRVTATRGRGYTLAYRRYVAPPSKTRVPHSHVPVYPRAL